MNGNTRDILDNLAERIYEALKAAFSEVIREHPSESFYTFAVFTDDSLQFLSAAANTEEALTATVKQYRETVDLQYGGTSTQAGMRWSYGDWGYFANFGEEYFAEINEALIANIDSPEEEYKGRIDSLWDAVLSGFQRLEKDGLFGTGLVRSKVTLLVVGDLPSKLVESWVSALNPPEVAERFINWDCDAPDYDNENA